MKKANIEPCILQCSCSKLCGTKGDVICFSSWFFENIKQDCSSIWKKYFLLKLPKKIIVFLIFKRRLFSIVFLTLFAKNNTKQTICFYCSRSQIQSLSNLYILSVIFFKLVLQCQSIFVIQKGPQWTKGSLIHSLLCYPCIKCSCIWHHCSHKSIFKIVSCDILNIWSF